MVRAVWSCQLRVGVPGVAGVSSSKAGVVREGGLRSEALSAPAAASLGSTAAHAHARQQHSGGEREVPDLAAAFLLPASVRTDSPSQQQRIRDDTVLLQAPSAPVQAWPLAQAQARLREAGRTGRGMAARGRGRGRGRANRLAHLLQLLRMAPAEPTDTALRDAESVGGLGLGLPKPGRMEGWLALRARIAGPPDTHRAAAWRAVQQAIVQEGVEVLAAALAEPAAPEPGVKARLRLCLRKGHDVCTSDIISSPAYYMQEPCLVH